MFDVDFGCGIVVWWVCGDLCLCFDFWDGIYCGVLVVDCELWFW